MRKPNLQLACDQSDLASALEDIARVGDIVDIIECGTILLLQEGDKAIRCMRALFPNKTIVADTKCADAGKMIAGNVARAGADWMTCICSASLLTMAAAAEEVKEVQIEIYGDWSFERARDWLDAGFYQLIYHRSREALLAGENWSEKDLVKIKQLIEMGFKVSVTGGLDVETLKLFKGIEVFTFIIGRAITSSENPIKAAEAFQNEISHLWSRRK
jgi:3-dehydro-L-gulonate-6-phosphate decarboxylase